MLTDVLLILIMLLRPGHNLAKMQFPEGEAPPSERDYY